MSNNHYEVSHKQTPNPPNLSLKLYVLLIKHYFFRLVPQHTLAEEKVKFESLTSCR